MRLISMVRDGNLAAVQRLVKVVQEIEEKLEFLRHRRLGFLTFCPTNLGTAIRASVHVHPPKLSVDYQQFKEIGCARSSGENGDIIWIEFNHQLIRRTNITIIRWIQRSNRGMLRFTKFNPSKNYILYFIYLYFPTRMFIYKILYKEYI